jgi:glyceraldehyde-3-phosphate dehydrogenase (NADP+)
MTTPTAAPAAQEWKFFVGGEFRSSAKTLEVRSPYDNSLAGVAFEASEKDIEDAIAAGQRSFGEMAVMPAFRKAELLRSMAAGVAARREDLSRLLALEAGKPLKSGRVEVDRAIFNFQNCAEEAQRLEHEFIDLDLLPAAKRRYAIIRRVPLGLIFAITPFNFPVNLVVHKIGPAVASGNTVVQKPSPKTPLTSIALAQIAQASGLPAGALNVLYFPNERAERLVADDRFKLLTFTGSSEVGWRLKARAGKKRVALELGGNAGVIVHSDADVDYAADRCAQGGFGFSGQSCISVQRIFAHRSIFEKFTSAVVDRARALVMGNPLDEKTDIGPLITPEAAQRVESWVKEAADAGAKLLTGGRRDGNILEPTVLTGTQPAMRVNCCEIFGPVVTIEPYDSFEKTLDAINDSPFGLQAGVFTRDMKAIFMAYEKLEVGGVMANDISSFRADHMPYGGMKDSGLGREGARYAIEEMTDRKTLVLNLER